MHQFGSTKGHPWQLDLKFFIFKTWWDGYDLSQTQQKWELCASSVTFFFLNNVLEELATHGNHVITIKMTKHDWAKQPPKELLFRQYGIYILSMCNKFNH